MASEPTSSQRESVALRAAIKRSPIVLRLTERFLLARAWASVRKSPDVDAYVLAWIASHVRGGRPRSGAGKVTRQLQSTPKPPSPSETIPRKWTKHISSRATLMHTPN